MDKVIVLSRRSVLAICVVTIAIIAVAGTIVANYIIPTRVQITAQPGLTVHEVGSGNAPGAVIVTLDFGDVQQGTSQSHRVIVKNNAGTTVQYLICGNSLAFQPLPTGVSLIWDCANVYLNGYIGLAAGEYTLPLTLTISATNQATPGTLNFDLEFRSFTTSTG